MQRLLIANRGEIARRIIRTAREMGLRTIAVYSEPDIGLPFVREADQAIGLGGTTVRESYLNQKKIIDAARATGADAIHPGYGFLSENAEFADAVRIAGLLWVGAPPHAIRAMGLKDAAKRLMREAGVPVTPGYMGNDQSLERLAREAQSLGYPVLIKAIAGGGGKGMRRVESAEQFAEALQTCQREAKASFGEERVLIEKYILNPRHIEVQVFADTLGNYVHLFERDCSIQRRHQKVIEEAPAHGMDEATRQAICEAAVRAARAVSYVGAGTVEFIADCSEGLRADRIWFMEMNTRLQVEHPVTEAVTGQDLVRWQLEIAAGKPLPKSQAQLSLNGWAVEGRLYAENPANGYLPSTGTLRRLRLPSGIRVDSGVEEGNEITHHYDPMIAKLVAHAIDRPAALKLLANASEGVQIWPIRTNANLLARIASDPDFASGAVDTGFLERKQASLVTTQPDKLSVARAAATLASGTGSGPWEVLFGFRVSGPIDPRARVMIDGRPYWSSEVGAVAAAGVIDDRLVMFERGNAWEIAMPVNETGKSGVSTSDGSILSPMPGMVVLVDVTPGRKVSRGDRLAVVEAMKMEHTLRAPFDGIMEQVLVTAGTKVSEGQLIAVVGRGES